MAARPDPQALSGGAARLAADARVGRGDAGLVHRGDRVRVGWTAPPGTATSCGWRSSSPRRHRPAAWVVHDRAPVPAARAPAPAGPAARRTPTPGALLAFHWGVALAHAAGPPDRPLGWSAVQVLP